MIQAIALALAAVTIPSATLSNVQLNDDYTEDNGIIFEQTFDTDDTSLYSSGIYTPNGSEVEAEYRNYIFSNLDKFNRAWDEFIDYIESDAYRDWDASPNFNGHSFAFYSQDLDNHYWIEDPSIYIDDRSYEKCTSSPSVGDIIVYYDDGGRPVHSGIVIDLTNEPSNNICGDSNTVKVCSKWDEYGVYEHKGDECPFLAYYSKILPNFKNATAVYVEFYKKHTHSYYLVSNGSTTHTYKCKCGKYGTTEEHNCTNSYTKNSNDSTYHMSNCKCGYSKKEKHIWMPYNDIGLLKLGIKSERDVNPLAIPRSKVQCKYCHFIKILKDDEIIAMPWM